MSLLRLYDYTNVPIDLIKGHNMAEAIIISDLTGFLSNKLTPYDYVPLRNVSTTTTYHFSNDSYEADLIQESIMPLHGVKAFVRFEVKNGFKNGSSFLKKQVTIQQGYQYSVLVESTSGLDFDIINSRFDRQERKGFSDLCLFLMIKDDAGFHVRHYPEKIKSPPIVKKITNFYSESLDADLMISIYTLINHLGYTGDPISLSFNEHIGYLQGDNCSFSLIPLSSDHNHLISYKRVLDSPDDSVIVINPRGNRESIIKEIIVNNPEFFKEASSLSPKIKVTKNFS